MARASAARKNQGPAPVPPEARPASQGATQTGQTVTIACKMPHGIVIHLERRKTVPVAVLGGGSRDEVRYERIPGSEVTIYGTARAIGEAPKTRIVAGYALTQGVPKEVWDAWSKSHADLPALKNGLLFAMGSVNDAAEEAKAPDHAKLRHGLEPINPAGDPRQPRPLNSRVGQVQPNDEVTHEFADVDEEA